MNSDKINFNRSPMRKPRRSEPDWSKHPKTAGNPPLDPIERYSHLDRGRRHHITKLLESVAGVPGDTAEVGVFRGGTSKFIAQIVSPKHHYAIDTFEGIPNADETLDKHKNGEFLSDYEKVKEILSEPNITVVKGYFPDCMTLFESVKFSFAHIDGDTYRTTIDSLLWFNQRMSPGGAMIFDDWDSAGCPGVKQAINEWFATNLDHRSEEIGNQFVVWF